MSGADTMREAARRLRSDDDAFHSAIADWLLEVYCATTDEWVDGVTSVGPVGQSELANAWLVARAYLDAGA